MTPAIRAAKVVEVGPRDGFQNIKEFIPTEIKRRVIEAALDAGIKDIEITSFVSPKAIPQMADAASLAKEVVASRGGGARLIGLVPNLRGGRTAAECGVKTVTYVVSASEAHNMANVRQPVADSMAGLKSLIRELPELEVRLDIATSFGCPYQGRVPEDAVMALAKEAVAAGVKELVLCDTIGLAAPAGVLSLSLKALALGVPVALHLHDTRGLGLVNAMAGLDAGVSVFEASVAGLGGCPFAPGATGNTATEDLLNLFGQLGIETGVSQEAYMKAVSLIIERVMPSAGGHMAKVAAGACGA